LVAGLAEEAAAAATINKVTTPMEGPIFYCSLC